MGNSMKQIIIWDWNTPDDFLPSIFGRFFIFLIKQLDLFIITLFVQHVKLPRALATFVHPEQAVRKVHLY